MNYIPILKSKAGEFEALRLLNPDLQLTPIIETVPIPQKDGKTTPSIDDHLDGFAKTLKKCWGDSRPIFVDLFQVQNEGTLQNGSNVHSEIFSQCKAEGIKVVPVIGLSSSDLYKDDLVQELSSSNRGACLRLDASDFDAISSDTTLLDKFSNTFSLTPESVDLVIDFGEIARNQSSTISMAAKAGLKALPHLKSWRSVTLAAGSMPPDLSSVDSGSVDKLPRIEWQLWNEVQKSIDREIQFGDYTVQHPEILTLDMKLISKTMVAKIKYTTAKDWLAIKGKSLYKYKYAQFHELAKILVNHEDFCGREFSWGDAYISECAEKTVGTGSLQTWVTVSVNHHITYVCHQLANLNAT